MNLRVALHVGAHKTGTTLFQRHIAANAEALLAQGVFAANVYAPRYMLKVRNRLRRLQNQNRETPEEATLAPASRHLVGLARAQGAHTILISDENILGFPFHRQMIVNGPGAGLYPSAAACLRLVAAGFEGLPLAIRLHTRAQHSLLVSHYSEALRSLQVDMTLAEFVEAIDLERLAFDDLIERIRVAAPDAALTTAPFEAIRAGADGFLADIFAAFGADPAALTLDAEPVRARIGAMTAVRLLGISREFVAGGRPQVLKRRARRAREEAPADEPPLVLPADVEAFLKQRYQSDIAYRSIARL